MVSLRAMLLLVAILVSLLSLGGALPDEIADLKKVNPSVAAQLPPWMTPDGVEEMFRELNKDVSDKPARGVVQSVMDMLSSAGKLLPGAEKKHDLLHEWRLNLGEPGVNGKGEASDIDIGHYAGYYKLNRTHDARLFYFFFESRGDPEKDPVVVWMTGGPGCASELALFFENGPFIITDDLSLVWNDYGWDKVASMIYVDQPVNVGFSFSHDPRDMRHDEKGVSQDMYMFLQEFFEAHPKFAQRDFFITGESYGGHYVPAVTRRIYDSNKAGEGKKINLKGFAMGNGLTQPDIQYAAYPDFAWQNKLVTEATYKSAKAALPMCEYAIHSCGTKGIASCYAAYFICNSVVNIILSDAGNINVYDVRKNCTYIPLCYDFSRLNNYLDQPQVRKALGVGHRPFMECNMHVYFAMIRDWMRNLERGIPEMVENGIDMLIYAGEDDFICNWLGNKRWVEAMPWSGHDKYMAAPWLPFKVDGKESGTTVGYGPVNFLKMYEAGHMVPMDQPKASLEMLRRWTRGEHLGSRHDDAAAAFATQ